MGWLVVSLFERSMGIVWGMMSGVHCGFITAPPTIVNQVRTWHFSRSLCQALSMLSDEHPEDHIWPNWQDCHIGVSESQTWSLCCRLSMVLPLVSLLSHIWRLPWGLWIGRWLDQIETRSTRLSVRPDTGLTARVIMQPVRNQFELLKFPPSLAAAEEEVEATGGSRCWRSRPQRLRCPPEPDFFRPPMNLPWSSRWSSPSWWWQSIISDKISNENGSRKVCPFYYDHELWWFQASYCNFHKVE